MSSQIRRIEKNIIKRMGVHRDRVSGQIVDTDGRVVGRGKRGTEWPRFSDIKHLLEVGGTDVAEA